MSALRTIVQNVPVVPKSSAVIVAIIAVIAVIAGIIVAVATFPIVPAMFATDVMTVDPTMTVLGPVAWDPDHFIVAFPVAGAMSVIWPIPDFNPESLRRKGSGENNAAGRYR